MTDGSVPALPTIKTSGSDEYVESEDDAEEDDDGDEGEDEGEESAELLEKQSEWSVSYNYIWLRACCVTQR